MMAAKKAKGAEIVLQYGDKSVSYDEISSMMKEKWTKEYGRKMSEIKSLSLYVKPEESRVYYVVNDGEEAGSYDI
ncbi:MAG: hypothetical protein IJQ21_01315 [Lachnospiraceae bacterium]|nr:hypothetical protein [Lachnospiraceae bacterium]